MSPHWLTAVMAATPSGHHSSGIPYLTIFGAVGTAIGILAAVQQFSSAIRRRRFQDAEERLLRAVESSKVISDSLSQAEQYSKARDNLRNEIEVQIPKQARVAYLNNRLEQLQDDLYRIYREYEVVRKELGGSQQTSELDQSIRDAISVSLPPRRIQESRTFYILSLVIILLLFNISSFGPDTYFSVVGDSIEYAAYYIAIVLVSGALCLVLVWLLLLSFVSNRNILLLRLQKLRKRSKIVLLAFPVVIAAVTVSIGFILWNRASYEYFIQAHNVSDLINYAEAAFNVSVVAFSVGVAVPISLRQRRVWQRGGGFALRGSG